eukprot:scaffold9783_cov113-Cylindrotheca_fusiformis.AAC.4
MALTILKAIPTIGTQLCCPTTMATKTKTHSLGKETEKMRTVREYVRELTGFRWRSDATLLSNNKDNNNNPVQQCINRFTISWLDTATKISAVFSICASTVGTLSSGGPIGWTVATGSAGTAFWTNTASVNRNFEEARNERHEIAERIENGFAEARRERHEFLEKMEKMEKGLAEAPSELEKGIAEIKKQLEEAKKDHAKEMLSNIEIKLLLLPSATPGIDITDQMNKLKEEEAHLKREIEQPDALESGQEWQDSDGANFIPASPTNEMV